MTTTNNTSAPTVIDPGLQAIMDFEFVIDVLFDGFIDYRSVLNSSVLNPLYNRDAQDQRVRQAIADHLSRVVDRLNTSEIITAVSK
jgi:hypothetical protein